MVGYLDPVTLISAMAAVTESVAFGITGSTSYISMLNQFYALAFVLTNDSTIYFGTYLGFLGPYHPG